MAFDTEIPNSDKILYASFFSSGSIRAYTFADFDIL